MHDRKASNAPLSDAEKKKELNELLGLGDDDGGDDGGDDDE